MATPAIELALWTMPSRRLPLALVPRMAHAPPVWALLLLLLLLLLLHWGGRTRERLVSPPPIHRCPLASY